MLALSTVQPPKVLRKRGRSTDSLDYLLSKLSDSGSAFPTDSPTSPTNKWRQWRQTGAAHCIRKSGPPLTRGLGSQKNIPVSVTKLTLGLWVSFISSHLTVDKLLTVNLREITGPPKMSLLLEVKSTPAFIIKPRLIPVAHIDDLSWYITSNQQGQMFVWKLNWIVSKPNVMPGQILYCTTDCASIDLMYQENFPTNTQV